MKLTREQAIAAGLCIRCGERPNIKWVLRCVECLDRRKPVSKPRGTTPPRSAKREDQTSRFKFKRVDTAPAADGLPKPSSSWILVETSYDR